MFIRRAPCGEYSWYSPQNANVLSAKYAEKIGSIHRFFWVGSGPHALHGNRFRGCAASRLQFQAPTPSSQVGACRINRSCLPCCFLLAQTAVLLTARLNVRISVPFK